VLPSFTYFRPKTLREALAFLVREKEEPCYILAGGTDLVLEMRAGRIPQNSLISDISFLNELRFLNQSEKGLEIGPLLTHSQITSFQAVSSKAPLLARACMEVGTPQVRARGTIGGNIVHASPAADSIPPLLLHDARISLISLSSERILPLKDFLKGAYRTDLRQDELLWKVEVPPLPGYIFGYERLIPRQAVGIARLIVCAAMKVEGEIEDARIVIGSASPVPFRATKAEKFLINRKPTDALFEEAGELAGEEMVGIAGERWSTPYKKPVLRSLVKRALRQAAAGKKKNGESEN
jgi:carbon-monoxide dehydrogenase medium subunit/xanthine dehydrogenase FAD-binding subunit